MLGFDENFANCAAVSSAPKIFYLIISKIKVNIEYWVFTHYKYLAIYALIAFMGKLLIS